MLTAPRILLLVHRVPFPPNRGDRIRSFHLLKQLAQQAEVSLAFLHQEPLEADVLPALQPFCEQVAAVPLAGWRRWAQGCWSLATGASATQGLFWSERMAKTITTWAREQPFDALVTFCSSMGAYASLPALRDTPLLVDLVDVDSQKWFDYAPQTWPPKRWLYRWEAQRLRRLEIELGRHAAGVMLVSEAEANLYRQFAPEAHVFALSNGVDLNYFRPNPEVTAQPHRCVFVGALDYKANIDGIRWFAQQVWPQVLQHRPEAKLQIVGRDPAESVQELAAAPSIELAANVPDVRPYVWESSVVIAPLQVARGIQNKVLEAMAMAKPVLASGAALEGIELQVPTHACQANSPEDWAQQLLRLFDQKEEQTQLGQAARKFVETHYDWPARLQSLDTFLQNCLAEQLPIPIQPHLQRRSNVH